MKSAHVIAIALLVALYACNSPVKKRAGNDTTTNRPRKVDSLQSITIDEPVLANSSGNSNQQKIDTVEKTKEQKDTRIVFLHFVINLHDYRVHDLDGTYDGDSSEVKLNIDDDNTWTVIAKKDSLNLWGNPDNAFTNNLVEIIPRNKTDSFKVSYWFNVSLKGRSDKNPVNWIGRTESGKLKDSAGYFFRVPKKAYDNDLEKTFQKKLHLRDTLITYADEYGTEKEIDLMYKNVPCVFSMVDICLRIDRFAKGKLSGIKYLVFYDDTSASE
jgi:hypothetical protein